MSKTLLLRMFHAECLNSNVKFKHCEVLMEIITALPNAEQTINLLQANYDQRRNIIKAMSKLISLEQSEGLGHA